MPTTPLLGSYGDISASQIAQAASALVPSGVVLSFAGATAPGGWLICDGSLINRTTYASLFSSIGTAHGSGDGATTFALPNYQGQFLRGRANGSANDPDRASRTAAASGGATGDNVGSVQVNATRKNGLSASATSSSVSGSVGGADGTHTHTMTSSTFAASSTFGSGTLGAVGLGGGTYGTTTTNSAHGHSFSLTAAGQSISIANGDNETRPLNAYVNYIIKI